MTAAAPKRPALRYLGGKWRLAPWIISHMPPHRIYVEPFGGAASVLLRKPRSYSEVYNDLDDDVVHVFRVLRDPSMASELARVLSLTPFARAEFEAAYEPCDDPVERARRIVFRSFAGFGSGSTVDTRTRGTAPTPTGFRSNSNRSGTTPAHDWMRFPGVLTDFTERLRGVVIEQRPAISVIQLHDGPTTLHYVDPPYPHATRGRGRGGLQQSGRYRHEMSDDEHRALADVLHRVEGMVLLSGYRCEMYDDLFAGWRRVVRRTHADGARRRTEVLWMNPAAATASGTERAA